MAIFIISALIWALSIAPVLGTNSEVVDTLLPMSECFDAKQTFDTETVSMTPGKRCDGPNDMSATGCWIGCTIIERARGRALKAYFSSTEHLLNRGFDYNIEKNIAEEIKVNCINRKFVMLNDAKCTRVCIIPKDGIDFSKCNAFVGHSRYSWYRVAFQGTSCPFTIGNATQNLTCEDGIWIDSDGGGKRRNMDLSPAVNLIEKVLVTPRGLEMIVHNSYGLDLWVTTDPATESMTSEQLRNHPAVLHKRPCVVKNGAIMIPIPTVTMGSLYLIAAQIRATESEYVLADEIEIPFDLQVKLLVDGYVKNNYPDVYPEDTVNMIHNSAGHHYSSWNMMTKEDEIM
eukprot:170869_1